MAATLKTENPWGSRIVRSETNRFGHFDLLADGIVICSPSADNVGLAEAKQLVALFETMAGPSGKIRLLLDQRTVRRSITPEGKKYLSEQGHMQERVAIVVANAISRFFASSIIAMGGGNSQMKVFDDVPRALAWLRER